MMKTLQVRKSNQVFVATQFVRIIRRLILNFHLLQVF